jgi:hypothetical protein
MNPSELRAQHPLTPHLLPFASEYALISFNISVLIVDKYPRRTIWAGDWDAESPMLVVAPKLGVSSSMTTEQGAFGRQNGLWIFQSLKREIRLGFGWR